MASGELDLKDRRILYELDCNARQPLSAIAKKVRLSKEVVNYRIERLAEKGVIKSFYARIDSSALGFLIFRTFVRLQNVSPKKEAEIIRFLLSHGQIGWLVSIQGSWDINFIYWARSNNEFFDFWKEFKRRYGGNIANRWSSLYGWFMNFPMAYLVGKKFEAQSFKCGCRERQEVDEADLRILDILAKSARMPSTEIAHTLGLTPKIVSYRIRKMEDRGIIGGYGVQLDLDKVGYEYWKIHLSLKNYSEKRFEDINNYCAAHPHIVYTNELIGGADFEIEGHFRGHAELQKFLKALRYSFSDIIRDFESMLYYTEYRLILYPSFGGLFAGRD